MTVLYVALGAAVGAPLRYFVDRALASRFGGSFPLGTLTVNVVGSFVLGLVGPDPLLGTGFCGALTTYSTFGYESVRLAGQKRPWLAPLNVAANVVLGIGAATGGRWLAP